MRNIHRNERGMALAVAVFAIVVVGALIAGALFLGTQEQRTGENQYRFQQSFGVVEAAAPEIIAVWDPNVINAMRTYPLDTFRINDRATASGTGSYGGRLFKLNRNLYYLDLTGSDTISRNAGAAFRRRGGGARQRLGVIVRVRPIQIPQTGAFTSQGSTQYRGNTLIDGTDHQPNASWSECATPDTTKPAFYVDGTVTKGGAVAQAIGDPPIQQDTAIDNNTFDQFGDISFADLAARATITLAAGTYEPVQPSTAGGVCNKSDPLNWGDGQNHLGACGGYFPIVYVTGDLTLKNWQGQGILLVDGNLLVAGNFEYFGIVIVRGTLTTSGGGVAAAHFHGTVLAKNEFGGTNDISGAAKVRYSKCAIVQALNAQSNGALARSRSWVRLYN
ncbi:MAG: hypothetical protein Q8Q14_05515 [Gemmatimonadales bacterium]|nr:hypothetical protein [Gemmatimonadales bacterium]